MEMTKTKILVLHTHIGYGIKMTAEAVAEKLQKSNKYEVRIEDVEDMEKGILTSIIQKTYFTIISRISNLWGFLYDSSLVLGLTMPLRKFIASFKSKHILQILRQFQPAVVISTQTIPSGIVAYLKSKGWYRGKLVIVFSDYHLQRFWLYQEADLYVCNIPEQMDELKKLGIPEEKMVLTGTIVRDKFFQRLSRDEARRNLGLLISMPVVLVTSGGNVRSSVKEIFLQLLRSPKNFQIAVVCGNNQALKQDLEKISSPDRHPVKLFGYIENMDVIMSAADVLVGKTGGPTMAEAVVKNLPMVLTDVRPGHELANLDYLVRHSIVQYARIPREAVFLVEEILANPARYQNQSALKKIVSPPGATDITTALQRLDPINQQLSVKNYQQI
ncbi:MAG: hypothetical protein HY395_03035 [Candidatus Doudnabacteria bacterium]|nr:hypothetical protein [Candidatus Doudnabacteria bacterium]